MLFIVACVLALAVLIRPTSNISNIREVKGGKEKKKDRCLMQQRQSVPEREVGGRGEGRYFEVYPDCLARANAPFTEVEWHISSH